MSLLALMAAAMLGAIACSNLSAVPPSGAVNLTVSVAASVQEAMEAVQAAYRAEAPLVSITYNVGASGSLAQQIAQGAPVDVFLSASPQWMDHLATNGQIVARTRQDLLLNSLVVIVPAGTATVTDWQELRGDRVAKLSIGEPNSVPAGRYAKETLSALQLFEPLQPKLVFSKTVRQVLAYVETGNVDAGLVYATDAKLSPRVQVVATAPTDSHSPIVYPVAVVAGSRQREAAQAFVEFLSSQRAIAIFEQYGFAMAKYKVGQIAYRTQYRWSG